MSTREGGASSSAGSHKVDVARLLAAAWFETARAFTEQWDPVRATEGAYSALLHFEGGAFASLTYSGYAAFRFR